MSTLQEIIPQVLIPHIPELRQPPSRSTTAGYAPVTAPPLHHVPYWILNSPTLAASMMESLLAYLPTAPGGNSPPSPFLQQLIEHLPASLQDNPSGELSSEETTTRLWDSILFNIILYAVKEVDQNTTGPSTAVRRTTYSQTPDALIRPMLGTSPRLHREDKSWTVFDAFGPSILALAQRVEGEQLGTSLELRINEEGARSIVMKIGVSMIGGQSLIPYGILFGGHKFMLFSLFRNADTLGEVRYGLACSDIIDCTNVATPLIPLMIYTLLGNTDGPVQLHQHTFTIPPVSTPDILDTKPVSQSRLQKFKSSSVRLKNVIFNTRTPSGAVSRSFMLSRESDTSKSVAPGPSTAYVGTMIPMDLLTSPFSLPKTPSNEQFVQDPFQSNAALVPFDQVEISLTECVGHGASGQVFIGKTDTEMYAIKIAPWKNGKQMLRREADMYEILSDLQGRCIPKIYGFFGSDHLKALIMDYMGHSVENISDLSMNQRHQLLEELCLIHERGVVHGDLRIPNIVLQNGSAHFIDFSHGYEHECAGRAACFELIEARRFLGLC